jgi:hypothetical protein
VTKADDHAGANVSNRLQGGLLLVVINGRLHWLSQWFEI